MLFSGKAHQARYGTKRAVRRYQLASYKRRWLMSAFERLLVPGCTELPDCRCGEVMQIARVERFAETSDAAIRVYKCPACRHEMRLTVWAADLAA
jgi:hypothetical protein